ncbi:MAG: type II secretion system F family protein, partial [Thaumarchaeota archaeon]|nr:type II secretion system F family protein [Nitrososphaerota archaeon]
MLAKVFRREARNHKLDRELPFAVMHLTLMASSGITPYESFRRLRTVDLLPATSQQSKGIIRDVEVLGEDPLTVIEKKSQTSGSPAFQDLLSGYVSTVKTGGSVVGYLKSKMRSAFDLQAALSKQAIEKLGMIVDAYMGILVIALSSFAVAVSIAAVQVPMVNMPSVSTITTLILISAPSLSLLFVYIAHKMRESTILGVDRMFRNAIIPIAAIIGSLAIISILPDLGDNIRSIGLPHIFGVALIGTSILPMVKYEKISRLNINAEKAMPRFIRGVVETRKTGLSPVRCIIQSARAKNYGPFTKRLNAI